MLPARSLSLVLQPGKYGQWIAATIVSMCATTIGFVFAWPSGALPMIREGEAGFHLDIQEQSWVVSILYAGTLICPMPSAYMMEHIGRRNSLCIIIWLQIISYVIMLTVDGFWPLIVARILQGFWMGLVYTVLPVYVGECTEPNIIGSLGTFYSVFLYTGSLIISLIGTYLSYMMLSLIPAITTVVLAILHCFIPESPYFYLAKGDTASARASITWLRGNCDDAFLNSIEESIKSKQNQKASFLDIIKNSSTRKAFIIVMILGGVQRTAGLAILFNYTSVTMPHYIIPAEEFTIILNVVWIISSLLSGFVMDKFGRRTLMGFSCTGSTIAMFGVATWFFLRDKVHMNLSSTLWMPFVLLIVHGIAFSFGLISIPTMMPGEVFSPEIKSKASSIVSVWVAVATGFILKVYFPLESAVGVYINFLIASVSSLIGLLTAIFIMIETQGKTLEEIHEELEGKNKKVHKSCP